MEILSWFCYLSWLNPILVLLFIMRESYPGSVIYQDQSRSWFCYLSGLPILVLLFIMGILSWSVIYHDRILSWSVIYHDRVLSWSVIYHNRILSWSVIYHDRILSWSVIYHDRILSWSVIYHDRILSWSVIYHDRILSWFCYLWLKSEYYTDSTIYQEWTSWTLYRFCFFNECFDIQVQSLLIFRVSQTSIICRFVCKGPIKLVASETTELTRQISLHLFSWIMIPLQLSTCLF